MPQEIEDIIMETSSVHSVGRGSNAEVMQQNNRFAILRYIKDAGIISRKDLSKLSGLTQATITLIIKEFLDKRLVEEVGLIEGNNGRRLTGIRLVKDRFCTIAVRITSQYFAVGLYDINSECLQVEKIIYNVFDNISNALSAICAKISALFEIAHQESLTVLAIAFSLMGFFRFTNKECIMLSESGSYIDLNVYFQKAFNCPIFYDSSVNYALYYIACLPQYNYLRDVTVIHFCISYSTEIAVLQNRHMVKGATTIPGAIGNVLVPCPTDSTTLVPLDQVLSTSYVIARAKMLLVQYPESTLNEMNSLRSRDLIEGFYQGDIVSLTLYSEIANALGFVINTLIHIFHPHCIYLSDEIPTNETFGRMVIDATHLYAPRDISYFPQITIIPVKRATALDHTMRGGSMFATNKIIKSPAFYNDFLPK